MLTRFACRVSVSVTTDLIKIKLKMNIYFRMGRTKDYESDVWILLNSKNYS